MPPQIDVSPAISTPNNEDAQVQELRNAVSDLLHPNYDTKYNLLRWLQSNEFNLSKSTHLLRKHLKWRRERHLDEDCRGLHRCKITEEYAPISVIGLNQTHGDRLVVVDQSGSYDIAGVMKSIEPTKYLHQLYRNWDDILRRLNEMEERLGRQCHVYYIFDMEGLSFDPSLLGIVNGAFRVSWQMIATHYREFIAKFIIVNTPSYMNVLWAAIAPFIPDNAKARIVFFGNSWKEDLRQFCNREYLPEKYGGTLCDEKVLKFPKPVPKDLYWKPRKDYPAADTLHKISVPASKTRSLIFNVKAGTTMLFYTTNDDDIQFAIYYSAKEEYKEEDLDVQVPQATLIGLKAMNCYDHVAEEDGYYHLRVTNEAVWLFPSQFYVLVLDQNGKEIAPLNSKEKWIKAGKKIK